MNNNDKNNNNIHLGLPFTRLETFFVRNGWISDLVFGGVGTGVRRSIATWVQSLEKITVKRMN